MDERIGESRNGDYTMNPRNRSEGGRMQAAQQVSSNRRAAPAQNANDLIPPPVNPRNNLVISESGTEGTYTDSSGTVYKVPEWMVRQRGDYVQHLMYQSGDSDFSRTADDYRAAGFPDSLVEEAGRRESANVPHRRHGAQYAAGFLTPQAISSSIEHSLDDDMRFDEDEETFPEEKKPAPVKQPLQAGKPLQEQKETGTEDAGLRDSAENVRQNVQERTVFRDSGTQSTLTHNAGYGRPVREAEPDVDLYSAPVHLSESMASYRKTVAPAAKAAPAARVDDGWHVISEEKTNPSPRRRKNARMAEGTSRNIQMPGESQTPVPQRGMAETSTGSRPAFASRNFAQHVTAQQANPSERMTASRVQAGVSPEEAAYARKRPVHGELSSGRARMGENAASAQRTPPAASESPWLASYGTPPQPRAARPGMQNDALRNAEKSDQPVVMNDNANAVPDDPGEVETETSSRVRTGDILYASFCILVGILCIFFSVKLAQRVITIGEIEKETRQIENQREMDYQEYVSNHPYRYREQIESTAQKYNLSPAFVAAIVLNESSFRTDATSSVGARGLMQLMDDTAQWIHKKISKNSYNFDNLYEAETNLEYGCWYLQYLSSLFHGDPILVSAAFHAGQGEISNWLNNSKYSKDGYSIDISNMPEGPTRTYVGRVVKAYGDYLRLYYDQK